MSVDLADLMRALQMAATRAQVHQDEFAKKITFKVASNAALQALDCSGLDERRFIAVSNPGSGWAHFPQLEPEPFAWIPPTTFNAIIPYPRDHPARLQVSTSDLPVGYSLDTSNLAPQVQIGVYDDFPQISNGTQQVINSKVTNFASLGIYNVKDAAYGAKGDGATDDTVAIQSAINAAQTAGGGMVWFPPGQYKITTALLLSGAAPVWLVGASWGAELKNTGVGNAITAGTAGAAQTVDVRVQDLIITGQAGTAHGVQFLRLQNARILRCRIRSHGGDGINFSGAYANWVEDNYVNNNTGWGFHATSVANAGNDFTLLKGNRFLANGSGGVYFDMATFLAHGVRIEKNDLEGNAIGLQIDVGSTGNSDAWTIRGNYFATQTGLNMKLGADGGTGFLRSLSIQDNEVGAGSGTHITNAVQLDHVQNASVIDNAFASADFSITANTTVALWVGNTSGGTTALPAGFSGAGLPSIYHIRFQDTAVAAQFADMAMTNGVVTLNWPFQPNGGLSPPTPALAAQTGQLYMGAGAPNNANGNNGDFYLRTDGTEAGHTLLYHKEAGVWVATAA